MMEMLKGPVYRKPRTIEELKETIEFQFDLINTDHGLLSRMVKANISRCLKCIEAEGGHLEHLIT